MSEKFKEFVEKQNIKKESVDFEKELNEWLSNLGELYREIRGFLKPYTDNGKIEIEEELKQIYEERLGGYEAKKLIIKIGGKKYI